MVTNVFDEDRITWRRVLIICAVFLGSVVAAGILLVVFRDFFSSVLL